MKKKGKDDKKNATSKLNEEERARKEAEEKAAEEARLEAER